MRHHERRRQFAEGQGEDNEECRNDAWPEKRPIDLPPGGTPATLQQLGDLEQISGNRTRIDQERRRRDGCEPGAGRENRHQNRPEDEFRRAVIPDDKEADADQRGRHRERQQDGQHPATIERSPHQRHRQHRHRHGRPERHRHTVQHRVASLHDGIDERGGRTHGHDQNRDRDDDQHEHAHRCDVLEPRKAAPDCMVGDGEPAETLGNEGDMCHSPAQEGNDGKANGDQRQRDRKGHGFPDTGAVFDEDLHGIDLDLKQRGHAEIGDR